MLTIALVVAVLAAGLHVFIFWLESFAWTTRARAVFGTTEQEALATRELAFNQGFYNLFLAIITAVGVALALDGRRTAGLPLVAAGTGSMLAAALVLFTTSPGKRGAAVRQGTLPLLALLLLLAWRV